MLDIVKSRLSDWDPSFYDFFSSLSKMNAHFVQLMCNLLRILKKMEILSQRLLHEEEDQKVGTISEKSDGRVQLHAGEPPKGTIIK